MNKCPARRCHTYKHSPQSMDDTYNHVSVISNVFVPSLASRETISAAASTMKMYKQYCRRTRHTGRHVHHLFGCPFLAPSGLLAAWHHPCKCFFSWILPLRPRLLAKLWVGLCTVTYFHYPVGRIRRQSFGFSMELGHAFFTHTLFTCPQSLTLILKCSVILADELSQPQPQPLTSHYSFKSAK